MSINSPTYTCAGGGTPLINSTAPYCIVPGGNKRMEFCCKQSGQVEVEFEPDCYSWCHIDINAEDDMDFQDALQVATNKFGYCLSHGENATTPTGMVCNRGTNLTQPEAQATITSTSSMGMQSSEATSSLDANGTSDNGAAAATHTGSAKAAGFIGILLAAGAMGGAV